MTRFLLLLLCLCGIGQALAETRYVTDMSQIAMRRGESTKYKILDFLKSGTPVQELRVNESTGYSRVRTEDGTIGYVLTRQLQDEPGARDRLVAMEARLEELQQAPDQLAVKLNELRSEHERLTRDHKVLARDKERIESELAELKYASANVEVVTRERSKLRMRVAELTRKIEDVEQKSRDLKNKTNQHWFLIGAGVVIGSILIGLVLSHLRFRRRKGGWGSF